MRRHNPTDIERALAGDKDLTEANLRGAFLYGADLSGADLSGAGLSVADLSQANLTGADLTGADLTGAGLIYANLTRADLTRANLSGAGLIYANLTRADLRGADLTETNLYGAILSRADLRGADLTETNLYGADLKDVEYDDKTIWPDGARDVLRVWRGDKDLHRAVLSSADLKGADLKGADLKGADLKGADLRGADLRGADLTETKLTDAILTDADLSGVNLRGANLTETKLTEANLTEANLTEANLTRADLTEANLRFADLRFADLTEANLTGADLTGAILTDAILEDVKYNHYTQWPAGFTLPQPERYLKRAYGKMTGPVLKFGKPEVPYRARDFKQKYPQEFDLLKQMTSGADFSPKFAEGLREANLTPYDWIVTHGKYRSTGQRLCPEPNFVLKLNIDLDDARFTEQQRTSLRNLAKTSRRSKHPHERDPLFTVGWVRICRDDNNGVWLIEEIQSDVQVARQQKNDERLGDLREGLDEVVEIMQPYVDRFYQDALGIALIEAEKLGFEVEMLDHTTKFRQGLKGKDEHGRVVSAAKPTYRDLPASMGISAKRKSRILPDLREDVRWTRPNPRGRRITIL